LSDTTYCYPPDFAVLINKFDIRDADALERAERLLTAARVNEGTPSGDFSQKHIQAIHRHIFQDVYAWAGELRSVNISKGGSSFMPHDRLPQGLHHVERSIKSGKYGQGMDHDQFGDFASKVISDLNYAHPFREGNGRTQMQVLSQLTDRAGFELATERINRDVWITASRVSHSGSDELLRGAITFAIDPDRVHTGTKAQEAVASYFDTVEAAISQLHSPAEQKSARDQVRSVAKAYETIMDRDTFERVLKEPSGRER
jgi:cell filamentation protein